MKMTLLYVKDCGQVMAAVTRAALIDEKPAAAGDPKAASPEVTALAGDALPVRDFRNVADNSRNSTVFWIPADQLAALTVERDEEQLLTPRIYAVADDKVHVPPPATAPDVTVDPADPGTITVRLSAPATQDTHLMLQLVPLDGADGARLQFLGVFKPATSTAQQLRFGVATPLDGDYDVLILVEGHRPAMRRFTV